MPALPTPQHLKAYFFLTWLLALTQVLSSQGLRAYADFPTATWAAAAAVTYALMYVTPAALTSLLLRAFLACGTSGRRSALVLATVAVVLASLTQVLLYADRVIVGMYGFHINGFVLNLVTTPGGIASLGASRSTQVTATLIVAGLCVLQALAYLWTAARPRLRPALALRWRWVLPAFLALTLVERVAYGYSEMSNYQPILFASERLALYQPLTFRTFAKRLGFDVQAAEAETLHIKETELSYPLQPLRIERPAQPLNIVWLVAESLRFDMLEPRIMPRLWALSNDALRLEKHFSGGNMTQMGVFSMFYGLYGNYWFPMLAARRPPVVMDVMREQGYQFSLNTSQRFTYPAFDKTVFAGMRAADLHPLEGGAPAWQRDVRNIDALIDFIDRRDPARPFMTYMFFESTHANYDFPDEAVIARPFLDDFNYLTADFERDIAPIKNRYINAAHHVDAQIGRLLDHLRARGLLERTVVIVLGDHGEEFMEVSRWGHSAEFNRFQTSTPAVIRVPGVAPRTIGGITSHLDIPPTLGPLLGIRNPPQDYALGQNLLAADFHRRYAVAADWNRVAYIGEDFKVSFPVNAIGAARNEITDGDDRPVADEGAAMVAIRDAMVEIMNNLARFSRSNG